MCSKSNKEEQLNIILDRVNGWVNNCDQKASIILAFLGALGTIIITSDIVAKIIDSIIKPMLEYYRDCQNNTFPWSTMVLVLLLVGLIVSLARSIHQFILTIQSRRSPKEYNKKDNSKFTGIDTNSLIYFDTISKMKYCDFEKKLKGEQNFEYDYFKDLCSQIYINSSICSTKFDHYKKGLTALKWFLSLLIVFFVLFLICNGLSVGTTDLIK